MAKQDTDVGVGSDVQTSHANAGADDDGDVQGEAFEALLDEKEQADICAFLTEQVRLAEIERLQEEQEWRTIRRQRLARPEFQHKDTPFPNASNVSPPGLMIAQNTMYGTTKNSFGAKEPFWAIEPLQNKDDAGRRQAKTLERYLQLLADSTSDLNKREADRVINEETDLMGTSFTKVDWWTQTYRIPLPSPDGTTTMSEVTAHDGPRWTVVPREEAFYRIREKSVSTARWWAHRIELDEAEMEERFATGEWTWEGENPDGWKSHVRTEALEYERDTDEKSGGGTPMTRRVFDVFEVFLKWDTPPKDGIYEELIVYFFRKANRLVKFLLNPMGVRTVREFNFVKHSFRMDGFGVGQAATQMQRELEFIHNARNDSVKITGLRMFVARKNCGIKPREILKAGKIIFVDNVKEDFAPIEAGETYPSSLQSENLTWQYIQKATLMSDSMSGFADSTMKSRDSIGLRQQRMKESSGIIGTILEGMEDAYSDLGLWTYWTLVYNKDEVLKNERSIKRLSDDELKDLEAILDVPLNEVPLRVRFSVRTAAVEQTYEMRRQNTMTLWAIYLNYSNLMMQRMTQIYAVNPQTGQPMLPPQAQQLGLQLNVGLSVLMEKLFVFFGEDDTKDLIPDYQKQKLLLEISSLMQKGMQNNLEAFRDRLEQIGTALEGVVQPGEGEAAGNTGNAGQPGMEGLSVSPGGPAAPGGVGSFVPRGFSGPNPSEPGTEQSVARSFGSRR